MKNGTNGFGFWRLVFICIVGIVSNANAQASGDKEVDPLGKRELLARDSAYVTPQSVGAPLGKLILIRHDQALCALRFTEFHRNGDKKAPTIFSSGEETLTATAQEMQITGGDRNWHIVVRKDVSLVRGPVVGLGRLGFQKGQIRIRCGNISLEWIYPNNVSLGSYMLSPAERVKVELAPTAWSDVSQISLSDPRLHWYRYDDSRLDALISIKDLPGS